MMRVGIEEREVKRLVKQLGGEYLISGEDGVARFADESGWALDCNFGRGPSETVFVGEAVTTSLTYLGEGHRLAPEVQDLKGHVREKFIPHFHACEAIVAHTTVLHGKTVDQMCDEFNAKQEEVEEDFQEWVKPESLGTVDITEKWGVLLRQPLPVAAWMKRRRFNRGFHEPEDLGPFLLRVGVVYVPLAEAGVR